MSASHGEITRRSVLRQGCRATGLCVGSAMLGLPRMSPSARADEVTPVASGGPKSVVLGSRQRELTESSISTTFAPISETETESDLTWEISFPDSEPLIPGSTNPLAFFEVRRGGELVTDMSMQWGPFYSSYSVMFKAELDYLNLFYPVLYLSRMPVQMSTAFESYSFTIDTNNQTVYGDVPPELEQYRYVGDALSIVRSLREPMTALQETPQVLMQTVGGGTQKTKEDCNQDRKIGWTMVIGAVVAGALAIPTGGTSALAFGQAALGFAAVGAVGGAGAAKVESEHEDCVGNVEEAKDEGPEEVKPEDGDAPQ